MDVLVDHIEKARQTSKQILNDESHSFQWSVQDNSTNSHLENQNKLLGAENAKSKFVDKTDQEIWDAFRNSDELAFIYIYSKYYSKLINYGWQFTRDKDLIEDCIQDLFIYLRKKRSRLGKLNSQIKVYLMFSFRRLILNYKKKLEKSQGLNDIKYHVFEIEESVESRILQKEFLSSQHLRLNQAIAKLSRKQREIIYYLYYQNLSYTEIKEIMQVSSVKTIRNTLYKALSSLRALLPRIILFIAFVL